MKIKALLYCCINGKKLVKGLNGYYLDCHSDNYYWGKKMPSPMGLNGKIVCDCEVDTEELLKDNYYDENLSYNKGKDFFALKGYQEFNEGQAILEKRSCCDEDMLNAYKPNYALHLSNIKVFDKPRELKECYYYNSNFDYLLKAPQNMCYAFEPIQFDEINIDMRRLVLISVRPQWLCLILNGKKDIEVRRVVLKGMVEIPTKKSKSEKPETTGGK